MRPISSYRRTEVILHPYVALRAAESAASDTGAVPDVLDTTIRTARTFEQVREQSSEQSRRWNIVTGLRPEDFAHALEASRAGAP